MSANINKTVWGFYNQDLHEQHSILDTENSGLVAWTTDDEIYHARTDIFNDDCDIRVIQYSNIEEFDKFVRYFSDNRLVSYELHHGRYEIEIPLTYNEYDSISCKFEDYMSQHPAMFIPVEIFDDKYAKVLSYLNMDVFYSLVMDPSTLSWLNNTPFGKDHKLCYDTGADYSYIRYNEISIFLILFGDRLKPDFLKYIMKNRKESGFYESSENSKCRTPNGLPLQSKHLK